MLKFEQIAVKDDEDTTILRSYMDMGHDNWAIDIVDSAGVIRDSSAPSGFKIIENTANLYFHYDVIPDVEFELLHYVCGDNFLYHVKPGALSHMGMHVDSCAGYEQYMFDRNFILLQEVITQNHYAFNDRRYHYAIYQHSTMGYNIKLIERLHQDYDAELAGLYERRGL